MMDEVKLRLYVATRLLCAALRHPDKLYDPSRGGTVEDWQKHMADDALSFADILMTANSDRPLPP